MPDIIERIGRSTVHHGKNNNRIYLLSLDSGDMPGLVNALDELAQEKEYTKIVVKASNLYKDKFESAGYRTEAFIPGFYRGEEDGCFFCKYFDGNRRLDPLESQTRRILTLTREISSDGVIGALPSGFACAQAGVKDIPEMAALYTKVFRSYPFPVYDQSYILKTMRENVIYYGIWHEDRLAALASIELAEEYKNAEMTDFAVLGEYRGSGLARYLLGQMEARLGQLGAKTAYTIARAYSPGINLTFSKSGYSYGGTLVKNTDIAGRIESMNVWYKALNK